MHVVSLIFEQHLCIGCKLKKNCNNTCPDKNKVVKLLHIYSNMSICYGILITAVPILVKFGSYTSYVGNSER